MPLVWSMAHQRGVKALPGYSIFDTPWAGTKTNTAWATRAQNSADLSGGLHNTDNTLQNNLFTDDYWLATGTFKVALIYGSSTDGGIHNLTGVSGTQTIDSYAAVGADVNYAEVTGVSVTAGTKTVQDQMATKNAASSAYKGRVSTMAWIRTGA